MTNEETSLCERIKRLGYVQGNQVKLYGEIFEVVSDPVALSEKVVFLEAKERRSGNLRQVRIPMNVIQVAAERRMAV